jgi:hypothetical protein
VLTCLPKQGKTSPQKKHRNRRKTQARKDKHPSKIKPMTLPITIIYGQEKPFNPKTIGIQKKKKDSSLNYLNLIP